MSRTAAQFQTASDRPGSDGILFRQVVVGDQSLATAYRPPASADRPTVLMFNGIGANLELALPFIAALGRRGIGALIFDVPGVGGSPAPERPYRPGTLAKLAFNLLAEMGIDTPVVVAGVSWGGAMAQQFARQYPDATQRLILVATSPGVVMIPGKLSAIFKMAGPRRYIDKGYMRSVAGELYGGAFRKDPTLIHEHAAAMKGATPYGYALQLLAMTGWTSVHWLHTLKMPTLVLSGTDDPLINVFNARLLASRIPNARLALIDDGHLFVVTEADATAAIVDDFISGDGSLAGYPRD
ncbi:MAG: poly(3-hydroxyalkanoate) depolymerase [Proteobacteria bacterium]|nr:poly(3-hydroxyalkanoate) depolymerase [Pseudomonadota bacterium]